MERAMFNYATVQADPMPHFPFSFAADSEPPEQPDSGLHDIMRLVESVAARYPVVRRLAGEESFLGAVSGFVFSEPPQSQEREHYGDTFPRFLRCLGASASFDYLADIAELESAIAKARHSASQTTTRRLSPQAARLTGRSRLTFHPSVSVVSSRFPIVTIWEANQDTCQDTCRNTCQETCDTAMIYRWKAEAVLVSATKVEVDIRRLPAGGAAFLGILRDGGTIADAIAAGRAQAADFDTAANLALLADARIAVGTTAPKAA
jgi:hypothetical protein